jgi:hypothetical protein
MEVWTLVQVRLWAAVHHRRADSRQRIIPARSIADGMQGAELIWLDFTGEENSAARPRLQVKFVSPWAKTAPAA